MNEPDYSFRAVDPDGIMRQVKLNADQAKKLKAGHPVTYVVKDERLFIDPEGRIVRTESARPAEAP